MEDCGADAFASTHDEAGADRASAGSSKAIDAALRHEVSVCSDEIMTPVADRPSR